MIAALVLALATSTSPQAEPVLALGGLDPVLLCEGSEVAGNEGLEATHGRYAYHFADEKSRARFLADPERWGIQWGGGCGRMGPLSGVGGPARWTVHAAHTYIFASDGCREAFRSAPEHFVVTSPAFPTVTPKVREAGAAWIERALQAHGGAGAIDRARALRLVAEVSQHGWTHRLEHIIGRAGRFRLRSTWTPDEPDAEASETVWVLGRDAWMSEDGTGFAVTSPDQITDLRRFAQREPLALLWARADEDFVALHAGRGELAGVPVEDVLVHHAGLATTLHLDPESGRILGLTWRGRPADGMTRVVVETFDAWREVDGVLLPISRTVLADGKAVPDLASSWTQIEALPKAPAGTFKRPMR